MFRLGLALHILGGFPPGGIKPPVSPQYPKRV